MKKLILAIFAVMCMQLAFVYFTALQSHMDLAIATPPVIPLPPVRSEPVESVPELPLPQTEDLSTRTPVLNKNAAVNATSEVTPGPRAARPAQERLVRANAQHPEPRLARPDDFRSVVISYKGDASVTDCDLETPEKPKKRSYLAKASPVVKAPWRFLKAVGSRLN